MNSSTHPTPRLRRNRLVRPQLQLRLIGTFLGVASLALLAEFVLLGYRLSALAGELPRGGEYLAAEIPSMLGEVAVASFVLLLPATLLVGVPITFRILGPVARFERHLASVARGEDPGPCRIRQEDELQELCQLINAALDAARTSRPASAEAPARRAS